MTEKKITAEELEKIFDEGEEDILQYADLSTMTKRINLDFPAWAVHKLDDEAKRIGGTRQALIRQIVIGFIDNREKFEFEKRKFETEHEESQQSQKRQAS